MMEPDRWGQLERLYHAALEREPDARSLPRRSLGRYEDLRREVSWLRAAVRCFDSLMSRAMLARS
jgi:hypothetical protein